MLIAVNAQAYDTNIRTGITSYTESLFRHIWTIDNYNEYIFLSNRPSQILGELGVGRVDFRNAPSPIANKYRRVGWENVVLPMRLLADKIDLLHSLNYSLPFKISSRIKEIITVYDLIWLKFPNYFPKDTIYFAKKRLQRSCDSANAIITISENTKKDIIESLYVNEEKITVIYCCVDFERFNISKQDDETAARVRSKYGLPEQLILWVGSYRKHKNVESLCRSFILAKKSGGLQHKLILCGSGLLQDKAILHILKNHPNDIMIIGPVDEDELPIIYGMTDVFVFPSLYEGFGLPVLEAMASGVPVITSNVSSLPEAAGGAAILVNPYDIDELAQAIVKVIVDKETRQILVDKGLKWARMFSWRNAARKTLELYMKTGRQ